VTFSIKPNAEMLDNYLYQFELRVVYTLNGKSIRTEFQVTNLEMEKTMPYFIGAHPAFNCPLVEGEILNLVRLSLARYQRVFLRQDY
jgi:galactose mutarotase-like enzyme